jgi:predicted RNase H-like HicB family nuclease
MRTKSKAAALDRPFDKTVWERARAIASRYALILDPEPDAGYVGSAVELPNVFADGRTPDACVREALNALTGVIARLLGKGNTPPAPASESEHRDVQLNVRVSARQKLLIERAARAKGFRGVSDYLRTAAVGDS